MTRRRSKNLFPGKPYAALARRVGHALRYLYTQVFPALGWLLSLGLVAAACTLLLFYGLAEEVDEGDTRQFDESALEFVNEFASPRLTSFMRAVTHLGSVAFLTCAGVCAVLAFTVGRWRRAIITLRVTMAGAALLVALIGFSRIHLGVHYPSDVAAGYAAGFVWVMVIASADRIMEARFRQQN